MIVTTRDGVDLAIREHGSRTASHTVVLLHGWCMNTNAWNLQVSQLIDQWGADIRVIGYDHRGHGDSAAAPVETYRVDQLADDLAVVLEALAVTGRLTLVGHSMGGMTALAYLGRPADQRPVEPHSIVLVATAAGKLAERGIGRLLKSRASDAVCAVGYQFPRLATGVVRAFGRPVARALRIWAEESLGGAIDTTPLSSQLGFMQGLKAYNHYATLPTITARTTIISGGADTLTPAQHGRDMAAGIAGARLIYRPEASHMVLHEEPELVTAAISDAIAAGREVNAPALLAA